MNPKEYYDRVAENYTKMITSGFGGELKSREKGCLVRLLSPQKDETILDAGCGSGFYAKMIRKSGARVFCVDISPAMIETVKLSGFEGETHDIQSLNLNRRFDKILCAGPLEFCRDPQKAIQNLRRHLVNGGHIVLSVLTVSFIGIAYWFYHLSHGLRINLFSLRKIVALLNSAGLKVEAVEKPTPFLFVIRARPI